MLSPFGLIFFDGYLLPEYVCGNKTIFHFFRTESYSNWNSAVDAIIWNISPVRRVNSAASALEPCVAFPLF
jgi:hypothetical protein